MKPAVAKRKISSGAVPNVIKEGDYSPGADERLEYIATAAYYKAEARGFVPGLEMDDWLAAEADFDEMEWN